MELNELDPEKLREELKDLKPHPCPFCGCMPAVLVPAGKDLKFIKERAEAFCACCDISIPLEKWQKRGPMDTVTEYIIGDRELTPEVEQRIQQVVKLSGSMLREILKNVLKKQRN